MPRFAVETGTAAVRIPIYSAARERRVATRTMGLSSLTCTA